MIKIRPEMKVQAPSFINQEALFKIRRIRTKINLSAESESCGQQLISNYNNSDTKSNGTNWKLYGLL